MMSNIRSRNTKPEVLLRQALHRNGFRFRINVRSLPGTPDIVLAKWHTAIFVHGCFWHQHSECLKAAKPSTNVEYWNSKFEANKKRDALALQDLQTAGWRVAVVWECSIGSHVTDDLVTKVGEFICGAGGEHMEF
jgi:DNA mismatch endonuclease (patch repair protein)